MVVRHWRGWIKSEDTERYTEYVQKTRVVTRYRDEPRVLVRHESHMRTRNGGGDDNLAGRRTTCRWRHRGSPCSAPIRL